MKIDIVLPWVTSDDPKWQALRKQYINQASAKKDDTSDNDEELFRDWDTLRYLLRGVHAHMPWVNRIFLVTMGQRPDWLQDFATLKDSKLTLVDHQDFIPKQYLPTFSSHVIELNFHRIPGLSEHFIYFNDDMLPVRNLKPTDFFRDGLPCDQAALHRISQPNYASIYGHVLLNNTALMNQHFSTNTLKKNRKTYSPRQGIRRILATMPYLRYHNLPGFFNPHAPQAFLKSAYETLWKLEPEVLDFTCQNKFRTMRDVSQYVFRDYQLLSNQYSPFNVAKHARFFKDFPRQFPALESALKNRRLKLICINDDINEDIKGSTAKMRSILENHFPTPSPWEIKP